MRSIQPINTFRYEAKRDTSKNARMSWNSLSVNINRKIASPSLGLYPHLGTTSSSLPLNGQYDDFLSGVPAKPFVRLPIRFYLYAEGVAGAGYAQAGIGGYVYIKNSQKTYFTSIGSFFINHEFPARSNPRVCYVIKNFMITKGLTPTSNGLIYAYLGIYFTDVVNTNISTLSVRAIGLAATPEKNRIEDNYRFFNR